MKLSEAILLGSTILAPKAGRQHYSESNAGCALGMAAIANGYTFRTVSVVVPARDRRTIGTEGVWGSWVLTEVRRPCNCWLFRVPREMRIKDIIAHLFDYHVMAKQNWTLEQLVAWVRTVEPDNSALQASVNLDRFRAPVYRRPTLEEPPFEPSQQEMEEWQAIRHAFAAKTETQRKRGRFR
jgi:hypothetical protein